MAMIKKYDGKICITISYYYIIYGYTILLFAIPYI